MHAAKHTKRCLLQTIIIKNQQVQSVVSRPESKSTFNIGKVP